MSAPSVKKAMDRTLGSIDRTREIRYFQIISEGLGEEYHPSSAWTFSRKDTSMIDEYIVKYEEYIGTGSGAFSYVDGQLLVNTFSLKHYDEMINKNQHPIYAYHKFTNHDRMRYRFLMELFDLSLDLRNFKKDFNKSIYTGLLPEMAFMWLSGAFDKIENGELKLKEDSRYLMVVMMREFFSNVNVLRDQARYELPQEEKLMCVVNDKLYHNEFA
jgi:coproporphyrinogen III oxidase-like Fe-S oxidoreductase